MTIAKLMQFRAALTEQIEAIPLGQPIDEVFQRRWAIEETILSCRAVRLGDLKRQLAVLAQRAADGGDVAEDLARLAA